MPDNLDKLATAFHVEPEPFESDWKGEDKIRNVRDYGYTADPYPQVGRRKPGRPPKDPPPPSDPARYDALILIAYREGGSLEQIAEYAGCEPIHVMRRIAYHSS